MSFTERTIIVTRSEFAVPVDAAYGASHVAISKGWRAADRAYREDHGLPTDASLPDNAIAFWPGDTEIVISYETERPRDLPVNDVARLLAAYDMTSGRNGTPYGNLPATEQEKYRTTARTVIDSLHPVLPAPARPGA